MAKQRTMSPAEAQDLRQILQTAAIAALMRSRRWEPGEIVFQGGTSLNLAHGSARFSEDLDFMVRGGMTFSDLSSLIASHIRLPSGIANDLTVTVTKGKDARNPHAFNITLGGPNVIGSAKVKVELWQTPKESLDGLKLIISTVATPHGTAYVPTLTLEEIHADKVYALGARNRIKPRDIFDLWWLIKTKGVAALSPASLLSRLDIYPAASKERSDTAQTWLENAPERLADLKVGNAPALVSADLQRWLPTYWKMDEATAAEMIQCAVTELENGIELMKTAHIEQPQHKAEGQSNG